MFSYTTSAYVSYKSHTFHAFTNNLHRCVYHLLGDPSVSRILTYLVSADLMHIVNNPAISCVL